GRAVAVDRADTADAVPRPDRDRADDPDHLGPGPAGPALVEGGRHRHRGWYRPDTAYLHPVPGADPQVPAGRRGDGNVRGDVPDRVRRAARRFQEVLADRAVRPRSAHRVRRLGG